MRDIPSLTAIRGVAALWVLTHHLMLAYVFPNVAGPTKALFMGFTGVDVFFVLSGFILTSVYYELKLSELGDYALRRIFRIYPLHLTVMVVMAVCTYFWIVWVPFGMDYTTWPEVALLIQPYLSLGHGLWNPVTWSAAVELSCYVAFPWALVVLRRAPAWLLVPLVLAAAYGAWHAQMLYAANWTGPGAVIRGWSGFWLGVALGLFAARVTLPRWAVIVLELAGLGGIIWAAWNYTIPPVPLAAGVLIFALRHQTGYVARVLSLRVPVYLGKISFSVYMLQLPLLDAFSRYWPELPHPAFTPAFDLRLACYVGVVIGLSSFTYHFIERPGQRFHRHLRRLSALAMA